MELDLNSDFGVDSINSSDDDYDVRTATDTEHKSDENGKLHEDYHSDTCVSLGEMDVEELVQIPAVLRNEIPAGAITNEIPASGAMTIEIPAAAAMTSGNPAAAGTTNGIAAPSSTNDIPARSVGIGNVHSPGNNTDPRSNDGGSSMEGNFVCKEMEKRLAVGSILRDLDEAYVLYCEYGRVKGFGIRKGEQRYLGRNDNIKWKEYVCCCAGAPDTKASKDRVPVYKKLVMRTGCKAKLRVSRLVGAPWRISIFGIEHNHGLVAAEQTYMLRSARNLSTANTLVLEALRSSGIGVAGAFGFMEKQCGGPQNLGFTRQDAYDHFGRKRKLSLLENADSNSVMQYFRDKANEEPFYYWNAETDDDGRLVNLFFRDVRSAEDYRAFGDVLSLDTTYRTNMYNLICAPSVGINHHTQTILFGMGFLSDETTTSFEWLFKEFLKSMNGVQPKVVFTDQCMAMMKAIETVFPQAKHRLCQWHINRNAVKKFGSLNGKPTFKQLWRRCMNEVETEDEFDVVWKELMTYTNPKSNSWFLNMYSLRRRWATVFTRGTFTGGLLATSRSEGTNRVVKRVQKYSMTLYKFVTNYEEMKRNWRTKEIEEDTLGIWNLGQLVSDNALFSQAASTYTRRVYKKFEAEATRTFSVVLPHDTRYLGDGNIQFSASSEKNGRKWTIVFNTRTYISSCSCRKWESEGLLCRHVLKVYGFMNHFTIPEAQIVKRWTKTAKEGCFIRRVGAEIRSTLPYMLFLNTAMRHLYEMACCCVDNEDGRSMIIERLESLRCDFFEIVGLPEIKQIRKVLTDLKCNDVNGCKIFRDPQIVKEKGFVAAREFRALQALKKQGTHETNTEKEVDVSCSMSQQLPSFEKMQVRTTPSLFPHHSAGWRVVDDVGRSSSQL